ncbi:MAG: hypothetical protein Pg6B_04510 [Candidatus Azobacteroides pseudotrichonymphae]|uniref:Uncharacterized protein n=1 Tax=Candidatus Improbicoccus pseudotrichonymphae TaxID=3033792 RepID=A0AA48L0Q5_9FIRM|nr:MAG: hypothetical protein CfP315_0207 [Candidatus Improbicoccus pseudotrichonymphae]GMO34098.1 MAG: hypothetical protein Pg6B_04510 [Candidatus Azobacteroides pseudotrichonymphae]
MINREFEYPKNLLAEFSFDEYGDIVRFSHSGRYYNSTPLFYGNTLYKWIDNAGVIRYGQIGILDQTHFEGMILTGRYYNAYDEDGNVTMEGDYQRANHEIALIQQQDGIQKYGIFNGVTDNSTKESIPNPYPVEDDVNFKDRWGDRPPTGYVWHYSSGSFLQNGQVLAIMQLVKKEIHDATMPHCDIIWQIKNTNISGSFPNWYIDQNV